MIEGTLEGKAVIRKLRDSFPAIARQAETRVNRALRSEIGPRIKTEAAAKAPKLFRDLTRSGLVENAPGGIRIVFGGQASAYAAKQHEDDSLHHPGRYGRYVYRGKTAAHPGDPNPPRGSIRTSVSSIKTGRTRGIWTDARGKQLRGKGGFWRRKAVHYAKRLPAGGRSDPAGQAHYLHGASNSAYEENQEWALGRMADLFLETFEQAPL